MNDDDAAMHDDAVVVEEEPYAFSGIAADVPDDLYRLPLPNDFARYAPRLACSNVVVTYQLSPPGDRRLNVGELCRTLPGVAYDPRRFAACTMRAGRATTLIFDRGSAVCVGTTSIEEARLASIRFTLFLLRTGNLVTFRAFRVQNIVCRGAANFMVDLNAIHAAYPLQSSYEAGKFPGLIFRMRQPRITIVVFVSGCCIITGSKSMRDSELTWAWFYTRVLQRFRLNTTLTSLTSAEYRMATLASNDTLAADCEAVWNAHCAATAYVTSQADGMSISLLHRGLYAVSQLGEATAEFTDIAAASFAAHGFANALAVDQ